MLIYPPAAGGAGVRGSSSPCFTSFVPTSFVAPRVRPGARAPPRPHSMHYARIGPADTQIRPRRKMHDFGDLGRALEMVALLPEVALGG